MIIIKGIFIIGFLANVIFALANVIFALYFLLSALLGNRSFLDVKFHNSMYFQNELELYEDAKTRIENKLNTQIEEIQQVILDLE